VQQAWAGPSANTSSPGGDAAAAAGSSRPKLYLPIDSEEQLPAAEAVIAALYDVLDALSSLQQQQLVDAVFIADKLGAPKVAQRAVDALTAAAEQAEEGQGLTAATQEALAGLSSWPLCLQPLLLPVIRHASCCDAGLTDLAAIVAADTGSRVQRMLLAVLGDLEAVWRDEQLQKLLRSLSLPALQLLLSSDDLRVASEDTILYTATKCVAALPSSARQAARTALALLIRAPHLTRSGLASQVLSSSGDQFLSSLAAPLKLLVSYKLVNSHDGVTEDALGGMPGAPESWSRGFRQQVATDGVRLEWRLPVEQVAQACRDSFAGNKTVTLGSPACTPPLGGVCWKLKMICRMGLEHGVTGVKVGLFMSTSRAARGVFRVYSGTLLCRGARFFTVNCDDGSTQGKGCHFKLGPMAAGGGWDEAAWAAAGLPVSGELELGLHVHSVG
jgi:hypothetical protein